jgi:hypothetical protein
MGYRSIVAQKRGMKSKKEGGEAKGGVEFYGLDGSRREAQARAVQLAGVEQRAFFCHHSITTFHLTSNTW